MSANIHNKNGELSRYGFNCGYQMTQSNSVNYKSIYLEYGIFNVCSKIDNVFTNYQYSRLTDARKKYKSIKLN